MFFTVNSGGPCFCRKPSANTRATPAPEQAEGSAACGFYKGKIKILHGIVFSKKLVGNGQRQRCNQHSQIHHFLLTDRCAPSKSSKATAAGDRLWNFGFSVNFYGFIRKNARSLILFYQVFYVCQWIVLRKIKYDGIVAVYTPWGKENGKTTAW